jgi:hypothetical protein
VDGLQTYWTLQHRHFDGRRWVQIASFADRAEAQAALETLIADGLGERSELRVRKVTRERALV